MLVGSSDLVEVIWFAEGILARRVRAPRNVHRRQSLNGEAVLVASALNLQLNQASRMYRGLKQGIRRPRRLRPRSILWTRMTRSSVIVRDRLALSKFQRFRNLPRRRPASRLWSITAWGDGRIMKPSSQKANPISAHQTRLYGRRLNRLRPNMAPDHVAPRAGSDPLSCALRASRLRRRLPGPSAC